MTKKKLEKLNMATTLKEVNTAMELAVNMVFPKTLLDRALDEEGEKTIECALLEFFVDSIKDTMEQQLSFGKEPSQACAYGRVVAVLQNVWKMRLAPEIAHKILKETQKFVHYTI